MEVNIGKLIMSLTDEQVDALLMELLVSSVMQVTSEGRFEVSNLGA
jgi:hypothetical protein